MKVKNTTYVDIYSQNVQTECNGNAHASNWIQSENL